MKKLDDFIMLATDSCRSRAYLDLMAKAGLLPSFVLLLKISAVTPKAEELCFSTLYENQNPLENMLKHYKIDYKILEIITINDPLVTDFLKETSQPYVIFSIPGYILGKNYFTIGKKYLHVHPGALPDYRGSTPMYYSILLEKKLFATALFLEEKIDAGPILGSKEFELPEERETIDIHYDPFMRANLLAETLKNYSKKGDFQLKEQSPEEGETYYIIHPVLKCLAIQSI